MERFDVERLKEDNPVEDVIARYVHLRRRGRTLVGLCPFHKEKDPSFTVWPGGGWYCFGCNEGGDVISFVMAMENVDFPEACRILGGGSLPELTTPPPKVEVPVETVELGRTERQALGLAQRVYHARLWSLPTDHPARQYLAQRKIDPDMIRRFGLGWCSGQDLIPALQFLRMDRQVFLDTGLLGEKAGRLQEFLRERIVIPERDPRGMVLHMVGRAIDDRGLRYLSLPGLPKPLYGLSSIQRQKPVVVVEGIFCRFSLERCGVQSVAIMGTALRRQASALKTIPDLTFVPQNDEVDDRGPTAKEWLEEAEHNPTASRWLEGIVETSGDAALLTKGQAAVIKWLLEVEHGQIIELPRDMKDVNDLDQAGGLEAWLDSWAHWRA